MFTYHFKELLSSEAVPLEGLHSSFSFVERRFNVVRTSSLHAPLLNRFSNGPRIVFLEVFLLLLLNMFLTYSFFDQILIEVFVI